MQTNIVRNLLTAAAVAAVLLSTAVVPAQLQKGADAKKEDVKGPAPKIEVKAAPAKTFEVLKKAVARPAPPVVAVDKAQKDAMLDNVLRQMRPVLRAELHLIRNICKPSKDEQAKLAKEGEKVLREVADKAAEAQLKMQQGIGVGSMPNAVESIQSTMAAAVKTGLSPAQAARYQAEVDARTKSERDVAARMLVARFDPLLNLSVDQRGKIAAALAKSNNAMAKSLDNLMYQNNYLPAIDDGDVVPFLDDRQKILWRDTQRVSFGTSFNYGIAGLNLTDDDLAEEDDPAVAAERAKKRVANEGVFPGVINGMLRAVRAAPAPVAVPAAPIRVEPAAAKAVPKAAVK